MFTATHSIRSDDSEDDDLFFNGGGNSKVHANDIDANVMDGSTETSERLTDDAKSSSSLENLPSEVRSQILSIMPDLPSLHALVHASPTMHAQYRQSRDSILHACLDRELDGLYVDAQATLMSRASVLGDPRTSPMIVSFAESYGRCLSGSVPRSRVGSTEPSAIRWLAAYHRSVARPMLRMYSKWALENHEKLAASVAGSGSTTRVPKAGSEHGADLSRSEEIRILRALYRYDTFCHLFGTNKSVRWLSLFYDYEVNEMFFCLFEPWEVEAIVCIDAFLWQRYDQIFDEIQDDLDDDNPKYSDPDSDWWLCDARYLGRSPGGHTRNCKTDSPFACA